VNPALDWRRGRDSNSRSTEWTPVFKTGGFNRSPTPPIMKSISYGGLSSSVYQFVYQFARTAEQEELYLDACKMKPNRLTSASKRLSGFGLVNRNPVVSKIDGRKTGGRRRPRDATAKPIVGPERPILAPQGDSGE
jgi:hypothetical protein